MTKSEKININADSNGCQDIDNPFLCVYINDFVKKFSTFNKYKFEIAIS
jgi:hypothetical protein